MGKGSTARYRASNGRFGKRDVPLPIVGETARNHVDSVAAMRRAAALKGRETRRAKELRHRGSAGRRERRGRGGASARMGGALRLSACAVPGGDGSLGRGGDAAAMTPPSFSRGGNQANLHRVITT